jgi:EpsI family protein
MSEHRAPAVRIGLLSCAALLLITQAVLMYSLDRKEIIPVSPGLEGFPAVIASWKFTEVLPLDSVSARVLGADGILNRVYREDGSQRPLNLFLAYYKTQHGAQAHDPEECLPGAGWKPSFSTVVDLPIQSASKAPVNFYIIVRGSDRDVVVYWFQTHRRVLADEQKLHLYRIIDTITDHRTDMALVRIVIPVLNDGVDLAGRKALEFAQQVLSVLPSYFRPQ